jgi:hypothetical protein
MNFSVRQGHIWWQSCWCEATSPLSSVDGGFTEYAPYFWLRLNFNIFQVFVVWSRGSVTGKNSLCLFINSVIQRLFGRLLYFCLYKWLSGNYTGNEWFSINTACVTVRLILTSHKNIRIACLKTELGSEWECTGPNITPHTIQYYYCPFLYHGETPT